MKRVWCVFDMGEGSTGELAAVFSTEKKAQKWVNKMNKKYGEFTETEFGETVVWLRIEDYNVG